MSERYDPQEQTKRAVMPEGMSVESHERFHVIALTDGDGNCHIGSVYASTPEKAMEVISDMYQRGSRDRSKEEVFAFHEAKEYRVVPDSAAHRFKQSRSNKPASFDKIDQA